VGLRTLRRGPKSMRKLISIRGPDNFSQKKKERGPTDVGDEPPHRGTESRRCKCAMATSLPRAGKPLENVVDKRTSSPLVLVQAHSHTSLDSAGEESEMRVQLGRFHPAIHLGLGARGPRDDGSSSSPKGKKKNSPFL
jgi:hypothetical protein